MQVGINVKCMHTNFSGHGLSSFEDIATFKFSQNSLSDHGLACTPILVGVAFPVSEIFSFLFAFKTAKLSLQTMEYSPWESKNRIK